ncbi:MAG: hypothetical protein IPM26_11570 [Saprospiraceae bacterium]|nr:hypothetical protein [Saprospiraceae bacterium]
MNNSNTEEPVGIRFQCKFPISNNICAKALNIFSDTIMTIPLQNAANDFGGKDCNLYNRNLWYKITGNGKLLTINIKDGQRAHLSMYKGSCSELDCILSTQTGTLNFIAEEGEEYYVAFSVVFANYPTAEFNFQELTGTSYQNYQIAQCNDKMLIDVKESVSESYNEYNTKLSKWYGIVGQGKFTRIVPFENNWILANCAIYEHNIQNKIFDQSLTDTVTLYLKNNVLYLFNFTTVYDRQEYFLECMDIPTGNECNSAVQIGCDDKAYYPHKSERTNTVEDGKINYNSSWYKIIGDGKVYEIKPRYNSSVWNKVSVFRTMTNCNNLEKIKTLENHDFPIGILCEEGFSYFIQLSSTLRPVELDFVAELDIKCYEKPAKPFCEDAEFISCNRQISIYNTDNIIDNKHRYGLPSSGIWMRLIGSDQFYSLHFNKNIFPFFEPISVFIYSGSCNELKFEYFRSIEVWDRTDNFTFETKAGRQYFIFVSGAYIGLDFEVKCHTQNVSVFCDKPLEFKCGDELEWSTVGLLSPEEVTIPECDNAGKGNGVYYYFIGNGQQINFHIDNLLNRNIKINQSGATCNDECNVGYLTPDQKTVSLSTKPGLYYTLKFSGEHEKHYKVQTTCEDRLWNSECKLADEITCGQIISCRFNTPVNYSSYFPEYFYDHKSAAYWYKLPRIDKAFRVKPLITGFSAYTLTIIRGDCTSLTCVQRSSSRVSDLVFTIESSQQYYLVIQGLINDNRNYDFVLECIDLINNIECSKAEQIQCNQILRYNGGLIPKPKLNDCFNSTNFKSIWFTFTGDGKEKILYYNTTQKDISTTLIILKGTGCDPRQNTQIYYMDNLSYLSDLFLTENGVKYFVHLQLSENLMDDFDFGFYCRGNEDHLACKNAQPLNPDDNIEFDYLGYPMTILKYNSSGNNVLKYRVVNQWYKVRGADSIFYIINESDETISLFFL